MGIKSPRWLLILEAVLLLAALLVVAYKAAMWVRPLGRVDQAQFLKKKDPVAQVHEYYRDYPERYIRVGKESWKYLQNTGSAVHAFTLTNTATVAYHKIEVRLTYQSGAGETLRTEVLAVTGTLPVMGTLPVAGLEVTRVPAQAEQVVIRVERASVAGS
jgi:hypothetical protein